VYFSLKKFSRHFLFISLPLHVANKVFMEMELLALKSASAIQTMGLFATEAISFPPVAAPVTASWMVDFIHPHFSHKLRGIFTNTGHSNVGLWTRYHPTIAGNFYTTITYMSIDNENENI
jgi:hypothetical protein